ncbi:uncharacterized protein ARMOST_01084 [Armillaria ostoyae]|uniref:Uncharacterized protein n=1 Tax=Armillaria ostoyae TaxID=47428 RepID=A0A284QMY5_ARMOS|nr:uncharacterized protein ARMOST_01084 [Armillaria ostoyae]
MARATIGRAAVERGATIRAALGRSPELKTPSPKRLTRSKAAKVKAAALEAVEESAETSGKPPASKAKSRRSSKLAPVGGGAAKESAGGAPSRPVRRSRAASVMAESVNERNPKAKAPPRVPALDKGKGKQKQVEEERTPVDPVYTQAKTTTKGKGKFVEIPEESDSGSDEDEERAAESDATEIVDESEITGKISSTEARKQEPVQPTDPQEEDLDPSVLIPKMNALVKEDIDDLKMINQLEDMLKQIDKDIKSILHGCQRERLFRDRLETFLRYCVLNNHPDSKYNDVTVQAGGRLDNGWTLDQVWSGGAVVVQWGPKDNRLATEDDEEEYWERDDEEIQKDLDELMPDSDEEPDSIEEGQAAENSGGSGNVPRDKPPSQPLSPSRKRPRDIEEEEVAPPARRIRDC